MNRAKQHAIDEGAKGVALETTIDNKNAQALYESLGYVKDVECYHYYLSV